MVAASLAVFLPRVEQSLPCSLGLQALFDVSRFTLAGGYKILPVFFVYEDNIIIMQVLCEVVECWVESSSTIISINLAVDL
jgi:hypothetical protein